MRWRGRRQSINVDDRRGRMGIPRGMAIGGGGGCGLLLLIGLGMLMGVDPLELLSEMPTTEFSEFPSERDPGEGTGVEDERAQFVAVVLADTEDVWNELFLRAGARYQEPTLVLFSQMDRSACGFAQAAVGPFYCPADGSVYIDLSFYDDLRSRFGAPGDFAQAYVIAHEV